MSGSFITHVPYRGSPQAIQDLIGGQIDMMFDNLSSIGQHIKGGRVRALAVSGSQRSPQFADIPTMAQAGAKLGLEKYETTAWGGIVAPAGTPTEIITRLNAEINKALSAGAAKFAELSFETTLAPASRLMERAVRERPMWAQVIARSGAKLD
jgi:tripartite-type tricarboxylate transporter receptor subunit TctC